MTAPFSFPKMRREAVGAARFTTCEKTLVFCRESPTIQPLGFSRHADRLAALCVGFSHLGRQTEREKIPNPAKNFS
jgi:hypothetical protein